MPKKLVIPLILAFLTTLLYGGFLTNPLVFDDVSFFTRGTPHIYATDGVRFHPRWWVYYSLGLTYVELGPNLVWLRLGNLTFHIATAITLFVFIRRLLNDLDASSTNGINSDWAAFLAALLFALHPVAVYGAGYLIQRTIVAATLFSLLAWLAFWLGLHNSRRWLWLSALFYFLAVFSKEHAVMTPAVCAALWVLHRRSALSGSVSARQLEIVGVLAIQGLTAVLVTYLAIGGAQEFLASGWMQAMTEQGTHIPQYLKHPFSILTQAGLFFKYLGLWTLPNVMAMAVDIREPFALAFDSPHLFALAAFTLYPILASWLIWRGRVVGLIGFSLLAPWLLFATELVSVRFQEVFVLYRSYLWAPPLFILFAMGLQRLSKRLAVGLGVVAAVFLFGFSVDRLSSFSRPIFLWDEAATLAEKKMNQPGEPLAKPQKTKYPTAPLAYSGRFLNRFGATTAVFLS